MPANRECKICLGTRKLRHQELVLEGDFEITDEYLAREKDCYYCLGRGLVCNSCGGGGYYKLFNPRTGYEAKTCQACKGDGCCKELNETQEIAPDCS